MKNLLNGDSLLNRYRGRPRKGKSSDGSYKELTTMYEHKYLNAQLNIRCTS